MAEKAPEVGKLMWFAGDHPTWPPGVYLVFPYSGWHSFPGPWVYLKKWPIGNTRCAKEEFVRELTEAEKVLYVP